MQHGNQLLVAKQYEKAVAQFLRHAKAFPDDASDAYASVAVCYRQSNILSSPVEFAPGIICISQGDLRSAEYYFRLSIQENANNIKALRGLSEILPESSGERLEILERAVEVQPGTVVLIDLGDFYRTYRKAYERSYHLYLQAQQHAPRDKAAYQRLNDICRKLGRPDEARSWSQKWKELK